MSSSQSQSSANISLLSTWMHFVGSLVQTIWPVPSSGSALDGARTAVQTFSKVVFKTSDGQPRCQVLERVIRDRTARVKTTRLAGTRASSRPTKGAAKRWSGSTSEHCQIWTRSPSTSCPPLMSMHRSLMSYQRTIRALSVFIGFFGCRT